MSRADGPAGARRVSPKKKEGRADPGLPGGIMQPEVCGPDPSGREFVEAAAAHLGGVCGTF